LHCALLIDAPPHEPGLLPRWLHEQGAHLIIAGGMGHRAQELFVQNGIQVTVLPKLSEGRPNCIDLMKDGKIQMVINTPSGRIPREDEVKIRSQVILYNIPYTTTIAGAQATVNGIAAMAKKDLGVKSLQEYHKVKSKIQKK